VRLSLLANESSSPVGFSGTSYELIGVRRDLSGLGTHWSYEVLLAGLESANCGNI